MPEQKTCLGTSALADAAVSCGVQVCACYPITPTTGLTAGLAKHYANGKIPQYITVESEFSALSALVGASAAGTRTFTTTGGQGLLLMHEVLFSASGMRLPIVMAVGNRAVSSPLNVWNDEQDTISQRDSGWIQFYAESNQEAVDFLPIAFKTAEKTMLPVMVCLDGHYLTHAVEPIEVPTREEVDKFLPQFNPKIRLDPENPVSLGVYAAPPHYQNFREDLASDLDASLKTITEYGKEYSKYTKRDYSPIEEYLSKDADCVFVSMGCMTGNVKAAVDELRGKGEKVGVVRIRVLRPFPREALAKALAGKVVGVIERAISPGAVPPIYAEVSEAASGAKTVSSFHGALGGRELSRKEVLRIYETLKKGKKVNEWVTQDVDALKRAEAALEG